MLVPVDLIRLCRKLGYEFQDMKLLQRALTHCSAGVNNYERFEFLGDSILSFVIANALFERFPSSSEGELSRLRSALVKGETLAEIALQLQLGDYLYLGPGELKSGGFRRASILSDTLEAVIAAVFLDKGLDDAKSLILRLFEPYLQTNHALLNTVKDAKTQLQEYLQAKRLSLPKYELVRVEGEDHEQIFHIECLVESLQKTTSAYASTRRKAEQMAARLLLDDLQK